MIRPYDDPARRCLKVDDWPSADREAWKMMRRAGHVLDECGMASHWSPATRHKNRRGYGRWLNFVDRHGGIDPEQHPADRVTKDAVHRYLELLAAQGLAPYTVVARIGELRAVISAMTPEKDWQWLADLVTRLRTRARPAVNKRPKLVPSADVFHWGLEHMVAVEGATEGDHDLMAVRYRDGLMIALLAVRPLRVSNLASIRIGHHLVRYGETWLLEFEAHEVKNRQPLELPFPDQLAPYLERYLDHWRPALLRRRETDHLWVTWYGQIMGSKATYRRITKVTERAFGWPLNPHLFRDCAATFIAIEDPEHVRVIGPLLGHASHSTNEKHYNQAQSVEAGRTYQRSLLALRRETRQSKILSESR
ncbi:MAG: tyrosine-type recombinase/integrase [Acidiferrobacterales bacterium]